MSTKTRHSGADNYVHGTVWRTVEALVNGQAQVRTVLVPQPAQAEGFFPALTDSSGRSRNLSSIQSPRYRPFAWQRAEFDAMRSRVRPTHALFLQPGTRRANNYRPDAIVRLQPHTLYRHPFNRRSCRAPILPYFPCSPSATRSVLLPRPAARRGSASPLRTPCGFRLSENLLCKERQNIFRTFRKSAAGPWERGTLASLRAGVSRGQSGQIQTGEKQWHSTPTK